MEPSEATDGQSNWRRTPGHRFESTRYWRSLPGGMPRRWWLFRPFDLIARHWPIFKKPAGLLVVRMDGIGDMVLFRSALDHYADVFGVERAAITILGCHSWRDIAPVVLAGYRVITINEHAYARRPFYRFKISLKVRRLAPAVVVCDSYMRRPLMADSLVWMSGAPRQVVSLPYISEGTRAEFGYYLSQTDEIINTGVYPTHEVIRHFRFLSALAARPLKPEAPAIAWRDAPPPIEDGSPYVVLNPGSNEPGRRWPFGEYLKIAEAIVARGMRVVFVGRSDEAPAPAELKNIEARSGMINRYARTTLPELLDLMKSAAAVVSNDTGPAHLAIALGVPSVVVVGGGHFGSFVPYPADVTPSNARFVFHEMPCYHCFWRCPLRQTKSEAFPCIAAVDKGQVQAALDDLLAERPAGRRQLVGGEATC
jgi:ADP-heptose:LPS heptosyltransferase